MYSLFLLMSFNAFAFNPYELADDTETVSNLVCSTAPIITCPTDYFGCPGDATSTAALGSATAVPGDADCATPVVGHYDIVLTTGPCTGEIFLKRIWYAYDPNDPSLMSDCAQEITLIDDTPPILNNCPADITVSPTESNCDAVVFWSAPSATDGCGTPSLTSTHTSGDAFALGTTTTITYTATDACNNSVSCSFTITVAGSCCFDPPVITCPATYNGCPGVSTNPSNTGSATAVPGGANCVTPSITYTDLVVSNGPCTGATEIERTWIATDPENTNSITTCTQTIILSDTTAPTLSSCPSDINVESTDGICATATWTAPTGNDNCGLGNVVANYATGHCFPIGTTTVTYTATDNCGNTATCTFDVIVEDASCQMPPALTCPSDYNACPGSSTDYTVTGNATVAPGGPTCGNPSLTFNDIVISTGPCTGATVIHRTWTATDPDDSSLVSTCLQVITLADNVNPTISNCPNDISLVSNDGNCVVATWTAPTASDNCGTPTLQSTLSSGACFAIGNTVVTYTATDNCGNTVTCSFNVFVEDLSCQNGPLLTCPADYTHCPGVNDSNPKVTGLPIALPGGPNCGSPLITFNDVVISTGSCGDTVIERTWTATDEDDPSFVSTCVQTISFTDNVNPVMSPCPANQTLSSTDGNCVNATWVAPTATDNCDNVTVTSDYNSGSCFPIGVTTVSYTATDDCGNTVTCNFTITVIDNSCMTPPTISCPADYTGCPSLSTDPSNTGSATGAAGSSNCAAPSITYTDVTTNPTGCTGATTITRTWIATDPSNANLSNSCVQIIKLEDTLNPWITCPADISLTSNDGNPVVATWTEPTGQDNCVVASVISDYNSGAAFPVGTTTVTYDVTDGCGNTVHCNFTVTVIDNSCMTPPTINCPADYYGCPSQSTDPSNTGSATGAAGSNNCAAPIITYTDVTTNPTGCTGAITITRTWTATDPSNASLSSTCVQIIELKDTTDPTITCPANITIDAAAGSSSAVASWTVPTGGDNCGVASVTSDYQSGADFPVGTTTVTYTVTDICDNTTSCSFDITVNPGFDLHCPTDITVSCDGSGGTPVTWELPTWKGGCGVNCVGGGPIAGFLYMGELNGHHYYCSNDPAMWTDAQATCVANGGYLAVINSAAENTLIANFLSTQSAYIGLSDHTNEGTFTWVDGSPLTYTNWYTDQPNNYNGAQHYVEMLSNGQWNDQYAKVALEYVMEIPCNGLVQTSGPTNGSELATGVHSVCYAVTDECNNTASCCFDITVESSISIACPNDVTFNVPNGKSGVIVNWNTPQVNSCCTATDCYNGGTISGFVYMGNHNGSHYYCSLSPDVWTNAQATCAANGGHLAIVNDATENAFLANLLTTQSAYIGLSDHTNEGTFTWVDGSALSYTNWYPGQPNNYNGAQHFVEMLSNGQWNDQYGKVTLEYIMEIPACNSIVQTTGPSSGSYFTSNTTTTITYEASDECGNVTSCSFDITINADYCTSGGQNSQYVYIDQCEFGPINNQSGNNGGYADFSNTCTDVTQGQNCPITLTPGFSSAKYVCYWKIYCDWNNDYDFFDTGELVAYGAGSGTINGNYVIPKNASGACRLRVVMKYGSYPTGPCEIFPHGETEDYCLNVLPSAHEIHVEYRSDEDAINLGEDIPFDFVIEDLEASDIEVSVFPNPASRYTNVEISSSADREAQITVFSSTGKVVQQYQSVMTNSSTNVDVSNLVSGIYMIQVQAADKVITKRLIVNN